jgi:hypothetical protein
MIGQLLSESPALLFMERIYKGSDVWFGGVYAKTECRDNFYFKRSKVRVPINKKFTNYV